MGIFSGLFRSRDKPQDRTAGSGYAFYFGGTTSGKAVTERSAMQMTAVYSCVRILAEAVAGLPLHLYRYKEDGGKEKVIPRDINVWTARLFLGDADGFSILYYQDVDSLVYWANEAAYRWGLRGIAIWSLGQEDMRLWEVMPKQIE